MLGGADRSGSASGSSATTSTCRRTAWTCWRSSTRRSTSGKASCTSRGCTGSQPTEIVAIGDDVNDLPMLPQAGLGRGDGQREAGDQAAAGRVIGRNDEDGLAMFLEELVAQPRGRTGAGLIRGSHESLAHDF